MTQEISVSLIVIQSGRSLEDMQESGSFRSFIRSNGYYLLAAIVNLYLTRVVVSKCHSPLYAAVHDLAVLLFWPVLANIAVATLMAVYRRRFGWARHFRMIAWIDVATSLLVLALARALRIPDYAFRGQVFGYIYALFLLIKLLELAWLARSNASDGEESRNGAYVFSAALVVYAAMTPWLAFAQFPTGDEPAYLLLTHSLIHEHDFNLENNYANRDYRNFYPFAEIDPHTVTTKSGVVFLWHDVGMSMLLIPGYWIGGRVGSILELNLAAAGVSLAFYVLGRRLGASVSSSVLTSFMFSFVVPMSMFASQVFPELLYWRA